MRAMRIAVVGAGGVGGYVGGLLAAAGNDVTFVARGEPGRARRQNGLTGHSVHGNLAPPVRIAQPAAGAGAARAALAGGGREQERTA